MIFDFIHLKTGIMKRLLYILAVLVLLSGCAVSKDSRTARLEQKDIEKRAEMAMVKKSVESRQYIVRMDKIFTPGGIWADLVPRHNYIIVDGEIASVSLAYLGRSYGGRPISGINFNGHTVYYKLNSVEAKGIYNIETKVQKGNDTFDFYLTISDSGNCSVSVNNSHLQSVSYRGSLVPITRLSKSPVKENEIIY